MASAEEEAAAEISSSTAVRELLGGTQSGTPLADVDVAREGPPPVNDREHEAINETTEPGPHATTQTTGPRNRSQIELVFDPQYPSTICHHFQRMPAEAA